MINEWNFRVPQAQPATAYPYIVSRLGQTLTSLVGAAASGGLFYGGIRLAQRYGYLQDRVLTLRASILFVVVSVAIQEVGTLLLEVANTLLGERNRFENLAINAQTTTNERLRKYGWKLISAFEFIPYQVDRLYSSVFRIRTLRQIPSDCPARNFAYAEIFRRTLLEEVVESSIRYVTQENALNLAERWYGYDVALIRELCASEYKIMFVFSLIFKTVVYSFNRSADQSNYDASVQINAGVAYLGTLRNTLAQDLLDRLPNVITRAPTDTVIHEQLLRAVITDYVRGNHRAAALPGFLTPETGEYIQELRRANRGELDNARIAQLLPNSNDQNVFFLEHCVSQLFGYEKGLEVVREVANDTGDLQTLLRERDRGALTLLMAKLVKKYGIDEPAATIPNFLPTSTVELINQQRSANQGDKTIFAGKCLNLETAVLARQTSYHSGVSDFVSIFNDMLIKPQGTYIDSVFYRCVEQVFPVLVPAQAR